MAAHPETPPEILERLSGDMDPRVRDELARRGYVGSVEDQLRLASDPSIEAGELLSLARSSFDVVRREVADCAELSEEVVLLLAQDPLEELRRLIAAHPSATEPALELLASELPLEVARHPACGPATLARRCGDWCRKGSLARRRKRSKRRTRKASRSWSPELRRRSSERSSPSTLRYPRSSGAS